MPFKGFPVILKSFYFRTAQSQLCTKLPANKSDIMENILEKQKNVSTVSEFSDYLASKEVHL